MFFDEFGSRGRGPYYTIIWRFRNPTAWFLLSGDASVRMLKDEADAMVARLNRVFGPELIYEAALIR